VHKYLWLGNLVFSFNFGPGILLDFVEALGILARERGGGVIASISLKKVWVKIPKIIR